MVVEVTLRRAKNKIGDQYYQLQKRYLETRLTRLMQLFIQQQEMTLE